MVCSRPTERRQRHRTADKIREEAGGCHPSWRRLNGTSHRSNVIRGFGKISRWYCKEFEGGKLPKEKNLIKL